MKTKQTQLTDNTVLNHLRKTMQPTRQYFTLPDVTGFVQWSEQTVDC